MEASTKKSIILRVSPELHQQLREYTVINKMTLQNYILELIKKDQGEVNGKGGIN